MEINFRGISLSHHRAPVDIRELIYLQDAAVRSLSLTLKDRFNPEELLIISTCNRTEIYYSAQQILDREIIIALLLEKGIANYQEFLPYFDILPDAEAAVLHLFQVSMGLKSNVLGDIQITYQIKNAYKISHELSLAGPFMHRLLHTIFHAGKRVQSETNFRDGAASVSYAAVEIAEELVSPESNSKVLMIGLGEMGTDIARNLKNSIFKDITLCNRSISKATQLANEIEAKVLPWEDLRNNFHQYDILFLAISTETPLITEQWASEISLTKHLYLIDVSVPRAVEVTVDTVPGVILFNIDDIQSRATLAMEKRMASIPKVEQIIQDEMLGFQHWTQELQISPTIHLLKDALEQLRKEEISRHLKNLDVEQAKVVEEITKNLMQKVLKIHVLPLKEACKRGDAENIVEVLQQLFNLEKIHQD
jgi:glutamyl-tRNA reductase